MVYDATRSISYISRQMRARAGRTRRGGVCRGCRERQWASSSSEKVSSAGNCIRGWKIGCRVEAGDRVNWWVWNWMAVYSIKLDKQTGRQLRYLLLPYTQPETAQHRAPKLLCPFSTRLDCGSKRSSSDALISTFRYVTSFARRHHTPRRSPTAYYATLHVI